MLLFFKLISLKKPHENGRFLTSLSFTKDVKIAKISDSTPPLHTKKIQFSATSIENGHHDFCIFV